MSTEVYTVRCSGCWDKGLQCVLYVKGAGVKVYSVLYVKGA